MGKLGTFISEYSVRNKMDENIPVYSVTNENGFCTGYFNKDVSSKDRTNYKIVPYGCFAYNPSRINVGSVDWQHYEDRVIVSPLYVVFQVSELLDQRYLLYYLKSNIALTFIKAHASGSVRDNLKLSVLQEFPIPLRSIEEQQKIADVLDDVSSLIDKRKQQLAMLDELVKARFVELFGDLKNNTRGWPRVKLTECAQIDTNMVHDFTHFQNYPHIGIDSIEKESGRLYGYRTVAEDGIISGKYLFSEKHIIYSKIRPNLNKVAMPNFIGVCSADAYPILVKEDICVKEYLAYTMRSKYFLDYILAFSNRTNLPKVNKQQVEGFVLPLPSLHLQQQFADFVSRVDGVKVSVEKSLQELETLKQSLLQQYFS